MKCLSNALVVILNHYGRHPPVQEIDKTIKQRNTSDSRFVDEKVVRSVLDQLKLVHYDFVGTVFMPIPFLLCNGSTWISVIPKRDKNKVWNMEVEFVGAQPGSFISQEPYQGRSTTLLPIDQIGPKLKQNGFFGGFFILPQVKVN